MSDIPAGFSIMGATDFAVRELQQLCFTLANTKWLGFTDAIYIYVVEQVIRVLLLGYAFISPLGCKEFRDWENMFLENKWRYLG